MILERLGCVSPTTQFTGNTFPSPDLVPNNSSSSGSSGPSSTNDTSSTDTLNSDHPRRPRSRRFFSFNTLRNFWDKRQGPARLFKSCIGRVDCSHYECRAPCVYHIDVDDHELLQASSLSNSLTRSDETINQGASSSSGVSGAGASQRGSASSQPTTPSPLRESSTIVPAPSNTSNVATAATTPVLTVANPDPLPVINTTQVPIVNTTQASLAATIQVPVAEVPATEVPVTEVPVTEVPVTEVPVATTSSNVVPAAADPLLLADVLFSDFTTILQARGVTVDDPSSANELFRALRLRMTNGSPPPPPPLPSASSSYDTANTHFVEESPTLVAAEPPVTIIIPNAASPTATVAQPATAVFTATMRQVSVSAGAIPSPESNTSSSSGFSSSSNGTAVGSASVESASSNPLMTPAEAVRQEYQTRVEESPTGDAAAQQNITQATNTAPATAAPVNQQVPFLATAATDNNVMIGEMVTLGNCPSMLMRAFQSFEYTERLLKEQERKRQEALEQEMYHKTQLFIKDIEKRVKQLADFKLASFNTLPPADEPSNNFRDHLTNELLKSSRRRRNSNVSQRTNRTSVLSSGINELHEDDTETPLQRVPSVHHQQYSQQPIAYYAPPPPPPHPQQLPQRPQRQQERRSYDDYDEDEYYSRQQGYPPTTHFAEEQFHYNNAGNNGYASMDYQQQPMYNNPPNYDCSRPAARRQQPARQPLARQHRQAGPNQQQSYGGYN